MRVVKLYLILSDSMDSFDEPFPAEEKYTKDEVPGIINQLEARLLRKGYGFNFCSLGKVFDKFIGFRKLVKPSVTLRGKLL